MEVVCSDRVNKLWQLLLYISIEKCNLFNTYVNWKHMETLNANKTNSPKWIFWDFQYVVLQEKSFHMIPNFLLYHFFLLPDYIASSYEFAASSQLVMTILNMRTWQNANEVQKSRMTLNGR